MMINILDSFILVPMLAAILIAIIAAPLGAACVWQRMAYFGDTIAHSGLLGVTFGVAFNLNPTLGIVLVAILLSLALLMLKSKLRFALSTDSLLGLLAHLVLALGLVFLSILGTKQVQILSLLYGDILAVSIKDCIWIFIVGTAILSTLKLIWPKLLRVIINSDLAKVEGVNISVIQTIYAILLACFIGFAMKLVGVLLITALLIIPAVTSRIWSKTPGQMLLFSGLVGTLAVILGFIGSVIWDIPTGPLIIVTSGILFMLSIVLKYLRKGNR